MCLSESGYLYPFLQLSTNLLIGLGASVNNKDENNLSDNKKIKLSWKKANLKKILPENKDIKSKPGWFSRLLTAVEHFSNWQSWSNFSVQTQQLQRHNFLRYFF